MANLKDIAERTGLSINTVSRALRGHGYVSVEAQQKVHEAAAELGYTPNRAARSLRSKRNFEIAVLVFIGRDENAKCDSLNMDKIIGIKSFLGSHGYEMNLHFIFSANNYSSSCKHEMKAVFLSRPSGVIIIGNSPQQLGMAASCEANSLPVVLISYSNLPNFDCVFIDREQGVYDAVDYLYRQGRRQIVFVGSDQCRGRVTGYRKGIAFHGLNEYLIPVSNYSKDGLEKIFDHGIATARLITETLPETDAIQAYSDYLAAGLAAGFAQQGKQIPRDIAIVGFDDRELAAFVTPQLTTLAQPNAKAGQLAAELMLRRINNKNHGIEAVKVPMSLVIRKST